MIDFSDMPSVGRQEGMTKCLQLLYCIHKTGVYPTKLNIVEIGTIRGQKHDDRLGDGWSTLSFGWFCKKYGGTLYTVDIREEAFVDSKFITKDYAENINYVVSEGEKFLKEFPAEINLLYLDGHRLPEYSYKEYLAAKDKLLNTSIVMIDDVNIKGKLVVPEIIKDGWNNMGVYNQQMIFCGNVNV